MKRLFSILTLLLVLSGCKRGDSIELWNDLKVGDDVYHFTLVEFRNEDQIVCTGDRNGYLVLMLTLADGSQVEAVLVGDEHGHYWKSADGRAFRMSARQDVFEETDAQVILQRAQVRRAKAEARREKRMVPARVGEYGNYVGQKKGLLSESMTAT